MALQSINLGPNPFLGYSSWTGSILLDSDLIVGGGNGYLREFGYGPGGISSILFVSNAPASPPGDAGPNLIPAIENGRLSHTFGRRR